ncbi:MAG: Transketolase central region [Rhodoferax sp.]|nr:Transketolase central region [Rhodoferax sp.]
MPSRLNYFQTLSTPYTCRLACQTRSIWGFSGGNRCTFKRHTKALAGRIERHLGPVYMRLARGNVPLVLDEFDYKFELGKAKMLREGADVLIISSGFMTMRALEVADALKKDSVDVAVLHCPTIKPLDEVTILEAVKYKPRLVVVAENHSVIGGLGEAIASALLRSNVQPAGFKLAGLPDEFLDAGALPTLHDRYGISRDRLVQRIKDWQQ